MCRGLDGESLTEKMLVERRHERGERVGPWPSVGRALDVVAAGAKAPRQCCAQSA